MYIEINEEEKKKSKHNCPHACKLFTNPLAPFRAEPTP